MSVCEAVIDVTCNYREAFRCVPLSLVPWLSLLCLGSGIKITSLFFSVKSFPDASC